MGRIGHLSWNKFFLNWNNTHWTVLKWTLAGVWEHTNSIIGTSLWHGRSVCNDEHQVKNLLTAIEHQSGACTLHRVSASQPTDGVSFLAYESRRAMIGHDQDELDMGAVATGAESTVGDALSEISIITINVDGCNKVDACGKKYGKPAIRINAILDQLLPLNPTVICFQEVIMEMECIIKPRSPDWILCKRNQHTEHYFVLTAVQIAASDSNDKTKSFAFPTSRNDRHIVSVRRGLWVFINAHQESGGRAAERDERVRQLEHISRVYESHLGIPIPIHLRFARGRITNWI